MNKYLGSWRAWTIWVIASLFYLYELILRIAPSAIIPELMHDFALTTTGVGALSAFYYYAYAPAQLPVGLLIDRYGARGLLFTATLICALGTYLFSLADHTFDIAWSRLLIGLGSAFAWVALTYLISHWFPERRRALMIGLGGSIGLFGGILGQAPLVILVEHVGWRAANATFGGFGILLAIAIFLTVKDAPTPAKSNEPRQTFASALRGLKTVTQRKQSWLCALFCLTLYLSVSIIAELWGITFLEKTHHISAVEAGTGTSLMYLGMLFGSPLIGLWSDMLGRRRPLMIAGSLIATLSSGALIFFKGLPILMVFALLIILGFSVGAQFLGFSVIIELNSPKTKGSALAFNNFVTTLGAVIMQPGVGLLLDISRNFAGRTTYSAGDYQLALSTLPLSALIAAALAWGLRETHGRDTSGHIHPFEPHCD